MTQKRIAVLTMSMDSPRLMVAGSKDGVLHIIKCTTLSNSLSDLKKTLPKQLETLRQKGFILLIDEVLPLFARFGRAVKLSDRDANNKPIIVSAMEAYRNLESYKAITYPAGSAGQYEIPSSIIDETRGADGKAAYLIDWEALSPETVALLFTVYAATQDSIHDVSSMQALLSNLNKKTAGGRDGASRFFGIVNKINREQLSSDIFDKDRL